MRTLCRNIACSVLAGVLASLPTLPLAAQDTATTVDPHAVSAEAQAVLDRMTAYLQSLQSFSIKSRSSRDELLPYGYKLKNSESASLVVQRPNRLRSDVSGDLRERTFVYDGSRLVIYSPDDKAYARIDAPDTIAKLVTGLLDAGVELPLIDVLYQSAAGTLTEQILTGMLVGDSVVEGVECDHLAFRQADIDWQLWVSKGAQPLPRKIVITTRYEIGNPQFEAILDWNLKPKINASTFAFVAPKGAVEIPFDQPAAIKGDAQ
ncbi:MAG: DUF2092 domain-containing protein [Pseudoxanthomonas sp.]